MPASRSQIGSMCAGLDGLELCSWPPSSRAGRPSTISWVPVAVARSVGSGRAPLIGVDASTAPRIRVTASSTRSTPSASASARQVHQAVRELVAELGRHGVRPGLGLPLDDRRDRADPAGQGEEEVARGLQRRPPVELGELGEGAAQVVEVGGHESAAGSSAPTYSNERTRTLPSRHTTPTIRPVMPPATSVER